MTKIIFSIKKIPKWRHSPETYWGFIMVTIFFMYQTVANVFPIFYKVQRIF